MSDNVNIYEELKRLNEKVDKLEKRDKEFAEAIAWLTKNKPFVIDESGKALLNADDDLEGFYTINDIIRKYGISRQTLHNYRKLVPLKKSAKIGRFDRFKKRKVYEFMCEIGNLKETQPNLFAVNFVKTS